MGEISIKDNKISYLHLSHHKQRSAELHALDILDTPKELYLDSITRLIPQIFGVPVAAVTLVGEGQQWLKSAVGIDESASPLDEPFCAHALKYRTLEVPDTLKDPFFRHHPIVLGSPFIRFYMGTALRGPTGQPIGTLCIMDTIPRHLNRPQLACLVTFGHLIEEKINHDHAIFSAPQRVTGENQLNDRVHVFSQGAEESSRHRHRIEQCLQPALINNRLIKHYQPLVAANGSRILGFEALARWHHHELGNVSPGDFAPVAEKNARLSRLMTEWSLRTVCEQVPHWPIRSGDAPFRISINIPASQFFQEDFIDLVLRVLDEHQLNPDRLTLELTEESLLTNVNKAVETMQDLRAHNIHITLDDFGTGYSSLSHLKSLPIDTLKIDKSLVDDLTNNTRAVNLVDGIIRLAHGMGMQVVCEGVEHETQRALLDELNCDAIQGYLFSRPLLANDALALLENWPPAAFNHLEHRA